MPPKKAAQKVRLVIVTGPSAWGCYVDDELKNWGGGVMSARELLRALDGRGVHSESWVDIDTVTEFPRLLSDLIGVKHES